MNDNAIVFVTDDDADLCEALCWFLEGEGLKVQTFTSAQEFLSAYSPEKPGVLVLDIRMPGMSGLELQQRLKEQGCQIPIIVLTGHGDVPIAVRALKAGALEFLQKPVDDQALLDCIRRGIEVDGQNRRRRLVEKVVTSRLARLTPREREVMNLVVAGKANKQIAYDLRVSEKTVEVHRKRVMKKMQVGSAVELVRTVLFFKDGQSDNVPASET